MTGSGLTEIAAPTAIQNVRSRAVMTKLGTTHGHRLKLISPRRFCASGRHLRIRRCPPATTTLGTYAHLCPTAEDRTRQAAGELMAAALPIPADQARTSDR